MLIRKEFKYEMAHIVRKAWSTRCSRNVHGHSYILELMFEWNDHDEGYMTIDFWLIKLWMNDFIDSFDHSMLLRHIPEDKELIKFIWENFERVIVTPFSSTAEMQAKMFWQIASVMLNNQRNWKFKDYIPEDVKVYWARVHETRTWWWEWKATDSDNFQTTLYPVKIFTQDMIEEVLANPNYIWISSWIVNEWKDKTFIEQYNNSL